MRNASAMLVVIGAFVSTAAAGVWVAYEGGVGQWGDDGEPVLEVPRYRNPASLALDAERGRLWFVEQYDYTVVCMDTASGKELFRLEDVVHPRPTVTPDTYSSTETETPPGLAVVKNGGSLWVADTYVHQVALLDEDGSETWRTSDFHEPYAVAVAPDGSAWIVGGISDVFHLSPDGEVLHKRKKGLYEPRDVAVDGGRDLVWITDYGNGRVIAVDYEGNLRRKVAVELPWSIVVDQDNGDVWVASTYDKVYRISPGGDVELTVDRFETPADVAVAPGLGVWVADRGDDRVTLLSADGEKLLNIDGVHKPVSLAVE
jgi:DNA-binding beta-propeller fold protein YncE